MLALLHVPTGNIIRFHYQIIKQPMVDLEFVWKFEFYRGVTQYPFKAWLEKAQAKIIADAMVNKEQFFRLNPFLKDTDVFMSEFEIVELTDLPKGSPLMDYDITDARQVQSK